MKNSHFQIFSLLFITFFFTMSCKNTPTINLEQERLDVLNTDFNLSEMSVKQGIKKAFLHYAAQTGVMLKEEMMPIEGKFDIEKLYKGIDLSEYQLSWKPIKAVVSKSADLAFTYGIYEYRTKNNKLLNKGTYVTIWEKQKKGNWKWILDSRNKGLTKNDSIAISKGIN